MASAAQIVQVREAGGRSAMPDWWAKGQVIGCGLASVGSFVSGLFDPFSTGDIRFYTGISADLLDKLSDPGCVLDETPVPRFAGVVHPTPLWNCGVNQELPHVGQGDDRDCRQSHGGSGKEW
eukprot:314355-Amphidinium_carterae.1